MSDNGPSGDTLSVAALAVALVALIVALGQILGQYFATAEGYRRCQASVMGPWARKTRMQWRWSQFRFETFFTTPEFVLRDCITPLRDGSVFILDTNPGPYSLPHLPMDELVDITQCNEMVCWISFLQSLYKNEEVLLKERCYSSSILSSQLARPGIIFRERSWDFMSPEIVRPFAVTNISDIGVIARRLGMTWTDFRPEDGVMRAEGNGHVLNSTMIRSIGVILQYMYVGPASLQSNTYIPSREADMLGFGILPGYKALSIPSFKIGTINDVYATMNYLDLSHKASQKIRDVRGIESTCTFGFSDLIPLAAPMMRVRGSTVIRLPVPTEYCVGLTCHKEGFVVFYNRVKEYIASRNGTVSDRIKWVLHEYESLKDSYTEWENEAEANDQANKRNRNFLDLVHSHWDTTSDYFIKLEKLEKGLKYFDLMASHTSHAVNYWGDAWKNIREGKARDHYGLRDWMAEGAHKYFDYLPLIADDMERKGANKDLVEEAWIMMMFRAFCWWRCHYINQGESMNQDPLRIPSKYWGSKIPVYIG